MSTFGSSFGGGGGGGGASAFIDLTDVPSSYSGQATKTPRVNAAENALEFAGSDYPVQLTIKMANATLTLAEQGIISPAPGIELTLPATAPNGTRFTIIPQGEYDLVGTIASYGAGTLTLNRRLDLIAANAPGLVWLPFTTTQPSSYDAARSYAQGDIALSAGNTFWFSRADNNVGNTPGITNAWAPIGTYATLSARQVNSGQTVTTGATAEIEFADVLIEPDSVSDGIDYSAPVTAYYEGSVFLQKTDTNADTGRIRIVVRNHTVGQDLAGMDIPADANLQNVTIAIPIFPAAAGDAIRVVVTNGGAASHTFGTASKITLRMASL